jgi:hypothetical protein
LHYFNTYYPISLEIEYLVAKEAGKILSTYKVQGLFDEAIEAAKREGAAHLHAFACERAGMYFDITGKVLKNYALKFEYLHLLIHPFLSI